MGVAATLPELSEWTLQINVHINHPDTAFALVSKDVGCEAFVLLEKQIEMRNIYVTSFFV